MIRETFEAESWRRLAYAAVAAPVALAALLTAVLGRPAAAAALQRRVAERLLWPPEPGPVGPARRLPAVGYAMLSLPLGLLGLGLALLIGPNTVRNLLYGVFSGDAYGSAWGGPTLAGAWAVHAALALALVPVGLWLVRGLTALQRRLAGALLGGRPGRPRPPEPDRRPAGSPAPQISTPPGSTGSGRARPGHSSTPPRSSGSGRGRPTVGGVRLQAAVAVLVAAGTLDLVQHYRLGVAAALGLSVLRAAPLALARSHPLPAWALTLAAVLLTALPAEPVGSAEPWPWAVSSVLAAVPVALLAGARLPRPVLAGIGGSVVVAGAVPLLLAPDRGSWTGLVAPVVLIGTALVAGDLIRDRTEARTRLGEQQRLTVAERARREALEERARIAREMHDVVAHGLALVTVRADSAPHRVADVSPGAAAEFAGIAEAARGTLTELRGLLGVLRGPGTADAAAQPGLAPEPGLAPQPGLTDLAALAESSRAAGVPVRLAVIVDGPELPPLLQLTAYRLVQEALSNVLRHAPGTAAEVSVHRTAGKLLVTVTNPAGTALPASGGGHGLLGMRERVAAVGGALTTGTGPDGRWTVAAELPVPG